MKDLNSQKEIEVDYINGVKTDEVFGRSKYQKEIHKRLSDVKLNVIEYNSFIGTIDILITYPFIVRNQIKKDNVKHITCQELAYLLKISKLEKTIVTCYDLIPWIYENNRSFIWNLNMRGLKKADRIITISKFSKSEIIKHLGYPEDRIDIINPAIDHENYYVKRDRNILKRFNIPESTKVILYVGSEMPRQNVPFLLRSFTELKKKLPDIKLLKVGNPQWNGAREELLKLTKELNIHNDVIFVGYVEEKELSKWYNAADLFVYPSLYSGWSLPCLEAMACGVPVITSDVSVFPEVVGTAGIKINPYDIDELAKVMGVFLADNGFKEYMIQEGLKRAKLFTWDKAAEETLKVYRKM